MFGRKQASPAFTQHMLFLPSLYPASSGSVLSHRKQALMCLARRWEAGRCLSPLSAALCWRVSNGLQAFQYNSSFRLGSRPFLSQIQAWVRVGQAREKPQRFINAAPIITSSEFSSTSDHHPFPSTWTSFLSMPIRRLPAGHFLMS